MLGLNFEGAYLLPGITDVLQTTEAILWWGRFEQVKLMQGVIAGSVRDTGNTPTDVLRPGLLLGKKTSDNKLYAWDSTATDGTQNIYGILLFAQKMTANGSDFDRYVGWVMVGGPVKPAGILVPGQASAGLVGQNLEYVVRGQLQSRFVFDDVLHSVQSGIVTKTRIITGTTVTLTAAETGTLITNLGATGGLTITLPAPLEGVRYKVIVAAAQAITIASASASQLVIPGSAAASSIALPAEIGVQAEIIGLSNGKFAVIVTDAAGGIVLADGGNLALGTTTGSKIGTAANQKLGFWNATPVVQPSGAAQAAAGAVTTVGANTGTAGAGLSLIGDTTSVNQASNIMNDFVALQEDISALQVLANAMRTALVDAGIIKGSA